MKLLNALEEVAQDQKLSREYYGVLLKLLAPFAPHITEELWQSVLSNKSSINLERWPEFDEALLLEESVTIVVQVNGKFRDTLTVKRGLPEEEIKSMVMTNEKVEKAVENKEIKKFIYIQDKLTNIVV